MEARVTSYSQGFRLRERMEEAKVRHGQEIRADLPGVRVTAMDRNWFTRRSRDKAEVFFCNMGPITIRETSAPGDGGALPRNVVLQGLSVPADGTYDLLDVLVQSNGDLRVILDEKSRAVPAAKPVEPRRYDPMFV
jgi:hypothetical protein